MSDSWVWLTLINEIMIMFHHLARLLSHWPTSAKFLSAQAESGRRWNSQNQSQPNLTTDQMEPLVCILSNRPRQTFGYLFISLHLYNFFQETIQQERFGPPSFPPDRKSPMSPPPGKEQPPKVASLPSCRSSSVSSTKSRSAVYASV